MTTPEEHAAVKALFNAVLDAQESGRPTVLLLEQAPPAIREAALVLLKRDATEANLLDNPLQPQTALEGTESPNQALELERIGAFGILQRIGAGGMGVVYEAVEDGTGRHVAVKVLAPGLLAWSGPKVRQRFLREIQALGRLEHPGIARILANGELGASQGSRPWFAMELVRGLELTEYITKHELDLEARVLLFERIAHAVAHAHERGIAHRDLKPANILVTGETSMHGGDRETKSEAGQPKVLDFGIARMFEDDGATRLTVERTANFVGTLAYLPPERLDSHDEDGRRGDVYALGCVFWEALFGKLPLPLDGAPVAAALRILRENEPDSAQTLELAADLAKTHPGRLPRDLAVILETAVAREPERRYPDAAALAADLERYRSDLPIYARAPSTLYRITKFTRRHRMLVAATLLVFGTLVAGILTTARESARARLSERRATAVRDFLLNDMLRDANPWRSGQVSVEDLLSQAQANMDGAFADDPETLALLRGVIGESWAGLGRPEKARGLLEERVVDLRRKNDPNLTAALVQLIELNLDAERPDLAAGPLDEIEPLAKSVTVDNAKWRWLKGRQASQTGHFQAATAHFDAALATIPTLRLKSQILASAATNHRRWGDYPAALVAITACLESTAEDLGPKTPELAPLLLTRASISIDTDRLPLAIEDLDRALVLLSDSLGPQHPAKLPVLIQLSKIAWSQNDLDQAEALFAQIRPDMPSEAAGPLLWLQLLQQTSVVHLYRDHQDEALADINRALVLAEQYFGKDHPQYASALLARSPVYEWRDNIDAAIVDLEAASAIFSQATSPLQSEYAETEVILGTTLLRASRREESIPHLQRSIELFTKIRGPHSQAVLFGMHSLSLAYSRLERFDEATEIIDQCIEIQTAISGRDSREVSNHYHNRATNEFRKGNPEAASEAGLIALGIIKRIGLEDDPNWATLYFHLAEFHAAQSKSQAALDFAYKSLDLQVSVFGADSPKTRTIQEFIDSLKPDGE